ncbi:MAG: CgeB family protein [Myxococcota bacterium]
MARGFDFAFFGSSLVSSYWNGAATYYRGLLRALAQRGHRITFYEPDAYERQRHRDIEDPDWARVVVYENEPSAAEACVARASAHADVLVKASGVGVHDVLLEEALVNARRSHQLAVFWDVDAPATLARVAQDQSDPFLALIPAYDLVCTYGGGDPVVEGYSRLGAKQCVPIYNALDPETHFPVEARSEFSADLSLLANRLPDRERRVEEFFLRAASSLPNRKFLLAGSGWGGKPVSPNVELLGHLSTRDHNAFNCSALAVLNVARDSMASTGFSPATRVFEAAGAAACLITDSWKGVELFLEPNSEVLVAHDGDEVAALIESLDPARARAIGSAARRRVLAAHTYARRAEQVEATLNGFSKSWEVCA